MSYLRLPGLNAIAFATIGVIMTCFWSAQSVAQTSIQWKLENGFRMFLDPENTQLHIDAYNSLTPEEKQNPIASAERRLGLLYPHGWAEQMYNKTCWHRKKHNYRKCNGKKRDYLHPRSHKIVARLSKSQSGQCNWKVLGGSGNELQAPCSASVKLDIPYPSGAVVEAYKSGQRVAQTTVKVTDLFIVGLGDSFASGEGNPDVPVRFRDDRSADYGKIPQGGARLNKFPARPGKWKWIGDNKFTKSKARWHNRSCHRSLYSHQMRVALQLAAENNKRAVTFVGLACSGAEALIGLMERYKGNEWHKYQPRYSQVSEAALATCGPNDAPHNTYTTTFTMRGQLPLMENLLLHRCDRKTRKNRKIDFLLVSIGGNDVGFSRLVANAVLKSKATLRSLGGWMGQVYKPHHAAARLNELRVRYKAINRAFHNILHIPWNEADRIILTAYPKISYKEDGISICPDGQAGMDLHPLFNVKSSKALQGEEFGQQLYQSMKLATIAHGWSFVEDHREQFAAHGYCAVNRAASNQPSELLGVPRKLGPNGEWAPYKPSLYRAYLPRQRWVRTPNDVYMATHQHVKRVLLRKVFRVKNLNPFQLIYAGTYGGSFHPTAEGQAVIADAVLKKVHRLLKKYKY